MKKTRYLLLILPFLAMVSCKSASKISRNSPTPEKTYTKSEKSAVKMQTASVFDTPATIETKSVKGNLNKNVISTAMDNLGAKYKYGGTDKSGFDCSGLVYATFKKFDIALPRSSYEMAEFGQKIKDSDIQQGDLVFFITNGGKRINHVGLVIEVMKDEILFVHSSTKKGVIVSSTKEPYYQKNYVKATRVLN
ncbi:MAG: C40 family peptidase [Flavobacteriaceae bacterium]